MLEHYKTPGDVRKYFKKGGEILHSDECVITLIFKSIWVPK